MLSILSLLSSSPILNYDTSSATETAIQLDMLAPGNRTLKDEEAMETVGSFLLEFYDVIIIIAKQIPYNHSAQARLVELRATLERTNTAGKESRCTCYAGKETSIWTHLDYFENVLRHAWSEPGDYNANSLRECINLNAFVSRLYGTKLLTNCQWGIWSLSECLEKNPLTIAILNSRVLVAAQWMEHSSSALLKLMRDAVPTDTQRIALSGLFLDEKVFSMDRWNY
ncbi:hypothetical protein EJ08DRAFT_665104 [Tothia fuscella]|uniref:Uncharacterized protein n=1 Tax=Tothia fuscella TaxID=1048955 RepID=A0A9P4NH67_9PEZI|nr:hypothetical protein EJ08DRAFT_665104 [Tothia fuscella]